MESLLISPAGCYLSLSACTPIGWLGFQEPMVCLTVAATLESVPKKMKTPAVTAYARTHRTDAHTHACAQHSHAHPYTSMCAQPSTSKHVHTHASAHGHRHPHTTMCVHILTNANTHMHTHTHALYSIRHSRTFFLDHQG